ncbi:hypothetical protein LINPERHAP1_LOCUS24906, partial [Linum perenne]
NTCPPSCTSGPVIHCDRSFTNDSQKVAYGIIISNTFRQVIDEKGEVFPLLWSYNFRSSSHVRSYKVCEPNSHVHHDNLIANSWLMLSEDLNIGGLGSVFGILEGSLTSYAPGPMYKLKSPQRGTTSK